VTDTLLLVEDDRRLATFLADNLTADGFELLVAGTVRDAQAILRERSCSIAIVDVQLPDGSGLDLIDPDADTRFLVLSGRGTDLDRVRGLQRGADDYLVKPFHYPELLLRVRALLRRTPHGAVARRGLRLGPLELDVPTRAVRVRGEPVTLSAKEFALLRALATDPTRVFTKQELLRDVWGWRVDGTTRTLDSHACRLRSKLGFAGDRFVINVWGVGYRLADHA
jgi:DNA-binding response OmpR family regulator